MITVYVDNSGRLYEVDADRRIIDVTSAVYRDFDRTCLPSERSRDDIDDFAPASVAQLNAWAHRLHQNVRFLPVVTRSTRADV